MTNMQQSKTNKVVATLCASALIVSGCGPAGGGLASNALCSVNGDEISKSELDVQLKQAAQIRENQGQSFPKKGSKERKAIEGQVIDMLVQQKLVEQAAKKRDVKVSEKEINERIKKLKQDFFQGDEKKYQSELKKQGLTEAQVKSNIELQLYNERLYESVSKDIKLSDADIKKYYEENQELYTEQPSRTVAHILVKEKALADRIYSQVRGANAATFARLAKEHSQDPSSKDKGGELVIAKGQTVAEFDKAAFALKNGEISKPVKTQFGWHIIKAVSSATKERQRPFDEVKAELEDRIKQERGAQNLQKFLEKERKGAEVECQKGYKWDPTPQQPAAGAPEAKENN